MSSRLRRTGLLPVLVGLSATAIALTSCSSSGGSGSAPDGALGSVLSRVHYAGGTAPDLEFGRPAAAVAANGGSTGSGPYQRAAGLGTGALLNFAHLLPHALGFDPLQATYAVTVGQPPKSGTLLAGLPSTSAVKTRATALGASASTSGSSTTYRFRPDLRIATDDKLAQALPGSLGPNVLRVSRSDLRYAQAAAGLDLTSGSGKTLADYAPYKAVASCLGNPLGAYVSPTVPALGAGRTPAQRAAVTPTAGITALGVGVSGAKGSAPEEQLCVSADSTAHATSIASAIRTALASGSSTVANERWSTQFTDVSVKRDKTTVSMTARPRNGVAGLLLAGYPQGDLPGLVAG